MKLGPFGMKMILRLLWKEEKKRRAFWLDPNLYRHQLDVDVLGDGVFDHKVDIYYANEGPNKKNKVLLDIHGGAYLFSNRKNNYGFASVFLEKGYDVVLLDYQPNGKGRGCLDQLRSVAAELKYLWDHAAELKLNQDQFYLMGDSAGGHFSLVLAEALGDDEYARTLGIDVSGIRVHGVAVCCPLYDFERGVQTEALNRAGKRLMFGPDYDKPEFARLLSPKAHLPLLNIPLFLSSCRNDFIKQESLDLNEDATKAGKDITYVFIDVEDQRVQHVHNVTHFRDPESVQVNDAMDSFFSRCA